MTERQKKLFSDYTTPGEMTVTEMTPQIDSQSTAARQASGKYCRQDGAHFEQKSLLGNVLYTYWQRVEICGNPGVKIDNVKVIDSGGETKTPTWSYQGQASDPASYRVGNNWHVRTSENFEQNVVVSGVGLGRKTVCISADIVPSGEYNANESCS